MRLLVFAFLPAVWLALSWPCQALAQSKHFNVSQRHLEELANKAADLSGTVDSPGEKNACNYYTATAMLYAVRAHALAQLASLEENLRQPEDQLMARARLVESRNFSMRHLSNDLRVIEGLSASTGNTRIKDLGLRLVNELRVFGHNAETASKN